MKKIILVDDELSSIQKMISMLIDQYDLSFCMFKEDPLKAIEYIRNFDFVLKTYFENIGGELIIETERAYAGCLKNVSEII